MKILLLGYSAIAQRRVLPAFLACGVGQVDVASRSRAGQVSLPSGLKGQVFDDYGTALKRSAADLVYISTENCFHGDWTKRALERDFHVIVDKPAFLSLAETQRLTALARRRQLCLAEATVYGFHPQIAAAKAFFAQHDDVAKRLVVTFSFPPLGKENFRYRRRLGGGALWDLGPYAVTPGRLFFGEQPEFLEARIVEQGDEVETSFVMMALYSGGRSLVGTFGFNTAYRNRLEILGNEVVLTGDRIFTTPPQQACELKARHGYQSEVIHVHPGDAFAEFFRAVMADAEAGRHESWADELLTDAEVLQRLRAAAGQQREG